MSTSLPEDEKGANNEKSEEMNTAALSMPIFHFLEVWGSPMTK
jgi:hypothetical protein